MRFSFILEEKERRQMHDWLPEIIALGSFACLVVFISLLRKRIDRQIVFLPLIVGGWHFIYSLPLFLGLETPINSPFAVMYCLINFPLLIFINIINVKTYLIEQESTGYIIFASICTVFWIIVAFAIGFIIDRRRKNKKEL
jgi:hypothetical protein